MHVNLGVFYVLENPYLICSVILKKSEYLSKTSLFVFIFKGFKQLLENRSNRVDFFLNVQRLFVNQKN